MPSKGPTIYALNHPTAFIDPMVIAAIAKPTMHFMLRGDMFKGRFRNYFLDSINTIPIFRFRDGFSNMKNNVGTMERVYQKLNEGANIIILAEGQCTHEKKMRPIQKGAARMAFGAYEKYGRKDIQIVPMGINFTDADSFRSDIMVDFGNPLPIGKFLADHKENPRKAIKNLTDEISLGMRSRIIHIDESEREPTANVLLEIRRNMFPSKILPVIDPTEKMLKEEWQLAEKINESSAAEYNQIAEAAKEYMALVKGLSLTDRALANLKKYNWKNSLILLIGLIPFLVGVILNLLPIWLAKTIVDKKIKKIEFKSSVRLAIGFFGWIIYYLLLILVFTLLGVSWWIILAIPFLGYFSLVWFDLFRVWNGARNFLGLPKATISEIQELRTQLVRFIEK